MKRNILFVDDNETMLELYRMLLTSERVRWEVRMAGGGAAALQLLATTRFDVVVSDLHMPGMSGLEFAAKLRRARIGSPIILVSAYGAERTPRELRRAGVVDYFTKPFQVDALRRAVRQALFESDSRRASGARKAA